MRRPISETVGSIVAGVLLTALVAACGDVPSIVAPAATAASAAPAAPVATAAPVAAWPADYQTYVCEALNTLVSSQSHLSAMSRAADALDLATVGSEAAAVADLAKQAQDDLVNVPSWSPGADLLRQMNAATANLRKAANEYQLGLSENDASLIKDGTALMTTATGQLGHAATDITTLQSDYGFSCP